MDEHELHEGVTARAEYDGTLHEGRITGLDDDAVVIFVEARGEHLTVPPDAVKGIRKPAFQRLLEMDPDLALDLLEEEIVALTGPESAAGLFEAHMELTSHKMAQARRMAPFKAKGISARVARARPNAERFSAFMQSQAASGRSARRLMRRASSRR
jgi:hypothetical protein